MSTRTAAAAEAALALLFLLLPFEPRAAVFSLGGSQVTLLELSAAVCTVVLLVTGRSRLAPLLAHPPLPLVLLAAYAVAHFVSAAYAPAYAGLAARFALRMAAAALFALAVCVATPRARRRGLQALAVSATLVALLALGEGLGLAALDPFLALFRERVFSIGAVRRATAGASGPNQAAAFVAAGLLGGVAVAGRRLAVVLPFAAVLSMGLLFTYSRGGLLAALVGLLVLAWALRGGAAAPAAAVLLLATAGFLVHPGFRERLRTGMAEQLFGARYAPADATLRMEPGESRALTMTLTNTGRAAWTPSERATLHAFLHEWPPRQPVGVWRQPLPAVDPGADAVVSLAIEAPTRPGTYLLAWDLFTLPSGFLSASGIGPALVPVGVGMPPPPRAAVELPAQVWRRGRLELWRLALAMWRDHPATGVGSDNFRRLHAQYGGWIVPGNYPMTAHNMFLEAAATTGALGLLALVGTLAFSTRAALLGRRGGEGERAAVLLALLALFAAQGMVDALLEFTSFYLLFAFVVGAAAAVQSEAGVR